MCGAFVDAADAAAKGSAMVGSETGNMMLQLGLIGAILGLAGGLLGKKMPMPAGVMMIAGGGLAGWNLLPLSLIVGILFLLGGVFCFVQKKETIE